MVHYSFFIFIVNNDTKSLIRIQNQSSSVGIVLGDPAWENRAYAQVKFDHFLEFEISYLCAQKQFINETLKSTVAHNGDFYAVKRACISYTEGEICGIMWRCVFCAHKAYFLMPVTL